MTYCYFSATKIIISCTGIIRLCSNERWKTEIRFYVYNEAGQKYFRGAKCNMPGSVPFTVHVTCSDAPDVLLDLYSPSTYSHQLHHTSLFGEIYYLIVLLGLA